MAMKPHTITLDIWSPPPGECNVEGLDELGTLELVYLHREIEHAIVDKTGMTVDRLLDGMDRLLAPTGYERCSQAPAMS